MGLAPGSSRIRAAGPTAPRQTLSVEYASAVSRRLGDRVRHFITHNEPWCAGMLSHQIGLHAPGLKDWPTAPAASHHLLLSHGMAVPVIRAMSPGAEVGITLNFTPSVPASPSPADRDESRHFDGFFNRWFLDPVFGRHYPADMVSDYIARGHLPGGMSFVQDGDLAIIATPCDFLGVNYYTREVSRSTRVPEDQNLPRTVHVAPKEELTDMGWEVYPDGLFGILTRIHLAYGPIKLYVTENGASYPTGPGPDGRVRDDKRIQYLRDHFLAAHGAIGAGAQLAGYFVWSLLDNYEWDRGYQQRFGIVHVDYATQRRTPKDSALWYRGVIAENAVDLP
ncbi:MAG: family 1 glycosylhydrolase [Polyangiaceae bacterium]